MDNTTTNQLQTVSAQKSIMDTYLSIERNKAMLAMAHHFVEAGCFGADVKNAAQAYVKIQAGLEMGMAPMEAMNSLYMVNGKLTIWGSAIPKRLREHGWTIEYVESDMTKATVRIKKGDQIYEESCTVEELTKLKSRAVQFAPKEKLRYHALSRLIRFYVPEVLNSGTIYIQEELVDDGIVYTEAAVVPETIKDNKPLKNDDRVLDRMFVKIAKIASLDELTTARDKFIKYINGSGAQGYNDVEMIKKNIELAFSSRKDELQQPWNKPEEGEAKELNLDLTTREKNEIDQKLLAIRNQPIDAVQAMYKHFNETLKKHPDRYSKTVSDILKGAYEDRLKSTNQIIEASFEDIAEPVDK